MLGKIFPRPLTFALQINFRIHTGNISIPQQNCIRVVLALLVFLSKERFKHLCSCCPFPEGAALCSITFQLNQFLSYSANSMDFFYNVHEITEHFCVVVEVTVVLPADDHFL